MSKQKTPTRKRKNLEQRSGEPRRLVVFSLRYFDVSQGQRFSEWEAEQLLALALERLRQVSNLTMGQAISDGIIKVYGNFPPSKKTEFTPPRYIPEGAKWASCHIQGEEVIAGVVEDNIFHIVFLDKNHEFWKSKLKNT
ncbi:MAG: hypothetical protein K9N38_05855 [Candidatus Marinimicrobia bacterium]|nr:hypothetical protein [Candidatus Neomarinimicrobiota bacterium]